MQAQQRSTQNNLIATRDFLEEHADVLGVLRGSPARTQLDDAIHRVASNVGAQGAANSARAVGREQASRTAAAIVSQHMQPIASFARVSLRGSADFAALTRRPVTRPGRGLVAAARSMATAATPLVPQFVAAKFPPNFVDQLAQAANQLEAALSTAASGTARRIAATSGIVAALKDGRDAVRMIDPVVTKMLQGTDLLAAWRSVKRVRKAPTPSTAPAVPAAPAAPVAAATPTPEVTHARNN